MMNLALLKKHDKKVNEGKFFDPKASESLGTVEILGIYRQPLSALEEGYVVTVAAGEDPHAFVYMFQATDTELAWFPIGRHESLESAEAFLKSMGATK